MSEISLEEVMEQSGLTAEHWVDMAYECYRKRGIDNPDPILISAYLNAAALDHHAMINHRIHSNDFASAINMVLVADAIEHVSNSLEKVAGVLEKDKTENSCGKQK
jgi:hypothetical protein